MAIAEIREQDVALLIGIEAIEGQAESLVAADVLNATVTSWKKAETLVERDHRTQARPLDVKQQATREWWEFGLDVPYAFSGVAGTPSALESVFRMCGADAVVVANTSVTYSRAKLRDFDSAMVQMHTPLADGSESYVRTATASRGQLNFKMTVGEDIVFSVASAVGNYHEPVSGAVITPNYGNQRTNLFGAPRASKLTTKLLNGKAICFHSIDATNFFGYSIQHSENSCVERAEPMDSKPAGTIKVQIEMPDWADWNPYILSNRSTLNTVPFAVECGVVAGKILAATVAEVQVGEPNEVILSNKKRGIELMLQIVHNPQIVEK